MVYLVDDAVNFRYLVQQVFDMHLPRYRLQLFGDGAELIQYINSPDSQTHELPRLIVLDIDMPQMNGIETLQRLKQDAEWLHIPVVMMTNRDARIYILDCYKHGASSVFLKPMNLLGLKSVLTMLCHYWVDFNELPE